MTYEIDIGVDVLVDSSKTCKDYNLGKELYDAVDINMDIIYGSVSYLPSITDQFHLNQKIYQK